MSARILALLEDEEHAKQMKLCLVVHELSVVNSFHDAMQTLADRPFDLIISDVHLENGGSVYDFLKWVKRNPLLCSIPFVLVSSHPTLLAKYLTDGVRTSARILGAAKYINMHTFDPIYFRTEIDELLPPPEKSELSTTEIV